MTYDEIVKATVRTWAFHNIVAHPAMQVLEMLGYRKAASWVHDSTLPKKEGE